jgi:hypothetical protein
LTSSPINSVWAAGKASVICPSGPQALQLRKGIYQGLASQAAIRTWEDPAELEGPVWEGFTGSRLWQAFCVTRRTLNSGPCTAGKGLLRTASHVREGQQGTANRSTARGSQELASFR